MVAEWEGGAAWESWALAAQSQNPNTPWRGRSGPVSFGTFRQALHNFELGTELVALSILTRSAPQPPAEEGRDECHGPVGHDFQHGRTSRSKILTRRLQGSALLLPGR
jgi:hypothetical protein